MTLTDILFVIGAYLWGAIPAVYLVARYVKGIDIRRYGSGNVGAANAMVQLGKATGFLLGVFDCVGKGTLPVVVTRLLGQGLEVQVAAGLAAVAGHNWSPYLRFTGGRGVATAIGVLLAFAMWQELLIMVGVLVVIGRMLFKETAFWTLVALLVLPVLAFTFDRLLEIERPPEIIYMSVAIGVLLLAKRLTANWERPLKDYPLHRVLMYRILWDRDLPKQSDWTQRLPKTGKGIP
jgi:glycerol-3-phosphate acyltransferase PlsY